jgi:hypothetical protein
MAKFKNGAKPVSMQEKEAEEKRYGGTVPLSVTSMGYLKSTNNKPKMTVEIPKELEPTLYITPDCHAKISALVHMCDIEVGWLGEIEVDETGTIFTVVNIHVPKQEAHGATCDFTKTGITELYNSLDMEATNKLYAWFHSHVEMAPNPSTQDDDQFVEMRNHGFDYFFRVITNKKGAYDVSLFIKEKGIIIHGIPCIIGDPANVTLMEETKRILEENVAVISYQVNKDKRQHGKVVTYYNQSTETIKGQSPVTGYSELGVLTVYNSQRLKSEVDIDERIMMIQYASLEAETDFTLEDLKKANAQDEDVRALLKALRNQYYNFYLISLPKKFSDYQLKQLVEEDYAWYLENQEEEVKF